MSLPIVEQIADKINTRLKDVTIANGYNYDAAEVVRPKREGIRNPKHLGIYLTQDDPISEGDHQGNPPVTGWEQPFGIWCFIRPDDEDTVPIDTINNQFAADVMKALAAPANWHRWDNLAANSRMEMEQLVDPEGVIDGMLVRLTVHYRTSETDPYTARD